jgi:hypothetical protein
MKNKLQLFLLIRKMPGNWTIIFFEEVNKEVQEEPNAVIGPETPVVMASFGIKK